MSETEILNLLAERTAADIVNGYPPAELARILHE